MKRTFRACLCLLLALAAHAPAQVGRRDLSRPAAGDGPAALPSSAPAPQGLLDARVGELSQQIAREMTDNRKRTVAVVEFADLQGRVTDFGRFLAEELITRLYQTRKFKVIERQLLNKVVAEQKLSLTGIIDQTSAQKLGRLLGVDAIATGTVTDLGRSLRVNARLIDTTTAEIFAVASAEVPKDDAVLSLMGEGVASGGDPNGAPPSGGAQAPRAAQKIESQFFTFELLQCKQSGTSVICEFRITNNDADRGFSIQAYESTLSDELGNSTSGASVQLADKIGVLARIDFVSGVTTRARVRFDLVSPQATRITLLKINFNVGINDLHMGGSEYNIRFRNVALAKSAGN